MNKKVYSIERNLAASLFYFSFTWVALEPQLGFTLVSCIVRVAPLSR